MVSSGVVALAVAVLAQVAHASFIPTSPVCGCVTPPAPVCSCVTPPTPAFEEGCCPGPVIEKKYVVNKAFNVPYSYSIPTYSKKCYQQSAGVDKKVIPSAYESAPVCETQHTIVKVPTTDVEVRQQPLCKKTCTTSEYLIQIPIVETTCTNTPLCKKTIRTQGNLLTTFAKKTSCAKQVCSQNQVVETPVYQTVCQDYQGAINKVGSKTIVKPEVHKKCVQLPPYKCLKPTSSYDTSSVAVAGAYPGYAGYAGYGGYGGYAGEVEGAFYGGAYPTSYSSPAVYSGYSGYSSPAVYSSPAAYSGYSSSADCVSPAVFPSPTSYYPGPAACPCA